MNSSMNALTYIQENLTAQSSVSTQPKKASLPPSVSNKQPQESLHSLIPSKGSTKLPSVKEKKQPFPFSAGLTPNPGPSLNPSQTPKPGQPVLTELEPSEKTKVLVESSKHVQQSKESVEQKKASQRPSGPSIVPNPVKVPIATIVPVKVKVPVPIVPIARIPVVADTSQDDSKIHDLNGCIKKNNEVFSSVSTDKSGNEIGIKNANKNKNEKESRTTHTHRDYKNKRNHDKVNIRDMNNDENKGVDIINIRDDSKIDDNERSHVDDRDNDCDAGTGTGIPSTHIDRKRKSHLQGKETSILHILNKTITSKINRNKTLKLDDDKKIPYLHSKPSTADGSPETLMAASSSKMNHGYNDNQNDKVNGNKNNISNNDNRDVSSNTIESTLKSTSTHVNIHAVRKHSRFQPLKFFKKKLQKLRKIIVKN